MPTLPIGFTPGDFPPELAVLELAVPSSVSQPLVRPGIDLNTTVVADVEQNAFGLQGSDNDQIETLDSFGDVNGDGLDDFIIHGNSTSYVLFGPISLTDLEDIETYAEVVIDHETLGRPADGIGDINADGIRDYAFVMSTDENVVIRVILGTPEVIERNWNELHWDGQLAANQRTIELPHVYLGTQSGIDNIGLDVLPFFGDTSGTNVYSDVLVYSNTTAGVFQNLDSSFLTGLIYSGELLSQSSSPMGIFDRSGDIIHESAGTADLEVVENAVSQGRRHILFEGTSVEVYNSISPAILTTASSSRIVREIELELTLDIDPNAPSIQLNVTPSGSSQSVALDGVVSEIRDAISANPLYRDRVRVSRIGTTQIQVESVERAGPQSLDLAEVVLTDPLGLVSVRSQGSGLDFLVGSHPVMPVGDGGVDVNFDIKIDSDFSGTANDQHELTVHVGSDALSYSDTEGAVRIILEIADELSDASSGFSDQDFYYELSAADILVIAHSDADVRGFSNGVVGSLLVGGNGASGHAALSSATTTSGLLSSKPRPTNGSVVFRVNNAAVSTKPSPGNVFQVGDLNLDGISDLGTVNELGHFDFYFGSPMLTTQFPAQPNLTITSSGTVLDAVVGDFNADGRRDLAVNYAIVSSPNEIVVFYDIAAHIESNGTTLDVIGADTRILAGSDDGFATQLSAATLDGDAFEDLIIGSRPAFNNLENDVVADGGRVYVAYGSEPTEFLNIPASNQITELENFSVAGRGSYVADRGTGRTEIFNDDGAPFQVGAGGEKWFHFSTLGDGKAGDTIRVLGDVYADLVDKDGVVIERRRADLQDSRLSSNVLANNPTVYAKFDEVTGTTVTDSSGNSHDGTYFGTPDLTAKGISPGTTSFGLDGDDRASIENVPITQSFSAEIWARSATPVWDNVGWWASSRENNGFIIHPSEATRSWSGNVISNGSVTNGIGTHTPADIQGWHHYAITYDGTTARMFFDGEVVVENVMSVTRDISPAPIGIDLGFDDCCGGQRFGNGGLDEFALYPTALTPEQIKAIYASTKPESQIFDLRTLDAGEYYLRVTGDSVLQSFSFEFDAPVRGQTHGTSSHPDRDLVRGGGGDDVITGSEGLDRLFGDSGNDQFIAEPTEIRDQQSFETSSVPPITELSFESLEPVLDPLAPISNSSVRVAIADAIGIPVTDSVDASIVHGPIRASDLTPITSLDLSNKFYTKTLVPSQDTFVDQANPNTAYASDDLWAIGTPAFRRNPLIKFDLSEYAGQTVVSDVLLRMTVASTTSNSSSPKDIDLYEFGASWDESATWNNQGGGVSDDFVGSAIDRQRVQFVVGDPNTHTITFRLPQSLIQRWIDSPSTNHGIALQNVTSPSLNDVKFFSSESASGPMLTMAVSVGEQALMELGPQSNEPQLPFLGSLDLSGNPGLTSIDAISEFPRLRTLDLEGTNVEPASQSTLATIENLDLESLTLPTGVLTSGSNLVFNQGDSISLPLELTAVDLTGGDHIKLNASASELGFQGNFTASAWIRPDDVSIGQDHTVFGSGITSANNGLHLMIRDGKLRHDFYQNGTVGNASLVAGEWIHVTFRYDNGEQAIFIDGVLDVADTGHSAYQGNHDVRIGDGPIPGDAFDGLIDNARVFSRALTDQEIIENMNGTLDASGPDVTLDLRLNEGSGTNAFDRSNRRGTATLVGASWATFTDRPWTVSGANAASGTTSPISFTADNVGTSIVAVQGERFPVITRKENVAPSIDSVPTLTGIDEGQTISVGVPTVGADYQLPIQIDGTSIGNVVITDLNPTDVGNIVTTATITDPLGIKTSLIRNALEFDDDALSLSNRALDGATNLTTAFWLKTAKTGPQAILSGANDSEASELLIELLSNTELQLTINGQSVSWTGLSNLADDTYRHLAVTRNMATGEAELFINGLSQGTQTLSDQEPLDINFGGLFLGQAQQVIGGYFDENRTLVGKVDELAIWNRALVQHEFLELVEGKVAINDSTLKLYLPFDEGAGDVVADRGPLGLDGVFLPSDSYEWEINKSLPFSHYSFDASQGLTTINGTGELGATSAALPDGVNVISDGRIGNALRFGPSATGVGLTDTLQAGQFGANGSYAVEFWFNTDNLAQQTLFAGHSEDNSKQSIYIELSADGSLTFLHRAPAANSGGQAILATPGTITADRWYHIAAVNDAGMLRLFVDGIEAAPPVQSTGLINEPFQMSIGALFAGSSLRLFQGMIDEVAVYDHPLSPATVERHYLSAPTLLHGVSESAQFDLVYSLNIPDAGAFAGSTAVAYEIDRSNLIDYRFDRVAYALELDDGSGSEWVYVSMDAFTTNVEELGLPHNVDNLVVWQQIVNNMNVFASTGANVTTGTGLATGNIEFWPYAYVATASGTVPNGSGANYDFDDVYRTDLSLYGSFQIHNHDIDGPGPGNLGETILAYNRFADASPNDLGIGNRPTGHSDWTLASNASNYVIKNLKVLVRPSPSNFTSDIPPALPNDYTLVDNGDYTLTVTASDGDGGFDESITMFTVNNVAPSFNAGASLSIPGGDFVGETFVYNANDVFDPGLQDDLRYLWEVTNNNGQPIFTSSDPDFEFVPGYAGRYQVWLTVTDSDGDSSPRTNKASLDILPVVEVTQPAPTATEGVVVELNSEGSSPVAPAGLLRGTDQSVEREYMWSLTADGSPVTLPVTDEASLRFLPVVDGNYVATLQIDDVFKTNGVEVSRISHNATHSFTVIAANAISIISPALGVEGDELSFAIAGLPELDEAATRTVEWSVDGVVDASSSNESFSFIPQADGTYTITATVTDLLMGTSFDRTAPGVNVTVDNALPTLVVDNLVGSENVAVTLGGSYADQGILDTHTVTIDWGDGTPVSSPVASAGQFSDSHVYLQDSSMLPNGIYQAVITLTDSEGAIRQQTISVEIRNTAPVANPDILPGTNEDTLQNYAASQLIGNDTDAGTLDVHSIFSVASFSQLGATVTLNGDGSVTYDPTGSSQLDALTSSDMPFDSFVYTITDEAGGQSTATALVQVQGLNDAPVTNNDTLHVSADAVSSITTNVLDNDSDVDAGTNLTLAEVANSATTPAAGTYGSLTWLSDGTVSYQPVGSDPAVLGLRENETLTEVFDLSTSDGIVNVASQLTITINGVNDVPVATDDTDATPANAILESSSVSVLDNDSDVDIDDQLSVIAVEGASGAVGVEIELPSGALLRVKSDGSYDYNPNGQFDYLPLGTSATDSFTYTIADEAGEESTATVTLTVNGTNEAPSGVVLTGDSVPAVAALNDVVGELFTTDVDQDDTHTYSNLSASIGSTPAANPFGISGSNLILSNPANLVADTTYFVELTTTDLNGLSTDQVFAVHVGPLADIDAPTSSIDPLPAVAFDLVIPITVSGSDSASSNGAAPSGIKEYQLFVSEDGGAFTLFATVPVGAPTTEFIATSSHNYFFRSLAVDEEGNVESKTGFDAQIIVGDFDLPQTNVSTAVPNAAGLFNIDVTGTDSGGGNLVFFDVYVSVDDGVAELVGSAGAGAPDGSGNYTASVTYQGRTDGASHKYRFFSIGRDSASNIESAPSRANDVIVTATFADVGLQATGIDVQLGASQRSYIRYLDVLFNSETGLNALLDPGRVAVEKFALNATNVTPGTGTAVTGFTVVKNGDELQLDFAADGITDNVFDPAGDGLYRVLVDVDQNGSFLDAVDGLFEFHRILGDANGDAMVDGADLSLITGQQGQSGPNLDGDVDGSGTVDSIDSALASFQNGVALDPALKNLLDD